MYGYDATLDFRIQTVSLKCGAMIATTILKLGVPVTPKTHILLAAAEGQRPCGSDFIAALFARGPLTCLSRAGVHFQSRAYKCALAYLLSKSVAVAKLLNLTCPLEFSIN